MQIKEKEKVMKNILVIGDVVGKCGREIIFRELPRLREEFNIDFAVVNGENATTGNGINEKYALMMLEAGADVITLGNHAFSKKEISHLLETDERIIRPLNISPDLPGDGVTVIEKDGVKYAVINLMGQVYMDGEISSPFPTLEKAVANLKRRYGDTITIVDFHAEATSEKQALCYYVDGTVSAFFGTHTHVQTNDARILKEGTGYITDIGMTGPQDSVIGLEKEIALARFTGGEKKHFKWSEAQPMLNGAVFTVDEETGKTAEIRLISRYY